ncbi:sorbosone dehydrogenase family protein, partial [Acinetobacter baumannii]
ASETINLGNQFKNGAFVSNHGSWNRTPLNGYNVVFISFINGKPTGIPKTVVSGFYSQDQKSLYGAPVGITEDLSGALLIADDVGNVIWRVSTQ